MKYTVTINEEKRSVTVTLANGISGTARCCPTDRFDLNTGIELALERARVASKAKTAPAPAPVPANLSVMELVKALEKALPKDEMVVVGNGDCMTEKQKAWLRSLVGGCSCKCHEVDEDEIYDRGYSDGYSDGCFDGKEEAAQEQKSDLDAAAEELKKKENLLSDIFEILKEVIFD